VFGPFGQDPLNLGVRSGDDSVRACRQPHQPGAAVGWVGHPLDVPGRLELFDEEAGTLLGDAGLLRQFGDAGAVRTDPGRDILVHTQDICVPLGIERAMPVDAAVAVADRVLGLRGPMRLWTPPRDVRLVATDADWAHGDGPVLHAPMQSHLLTLTGRQPSFIKSDHSQS
jgi:hypothetical protein